ncbi:hypothetical protein [Bosea sp. (in: a-proteobacteria)]|uniref:hypothetical protein n=1 Tax=Bosea sp. (in: a-proteobacteria) TaxID=1871050 RepID=UPI003B3A69AC
MSDQKPSPTMTAEDVGAALAGFALSLAPLLERKDLSPNELLSELVEELRDLVSGMQRHGDTGTPAAEAMLQAAAMLEASAPNSEQNG